MIVNTQHYTTINGRYQLQSQLGQGGMGVVYRVRDGLTDATVALKQVTQPPPQPKTSPPQSEDALRLALAREFQLLAGLRHPHIISVLDYGFDAQRQPFFTMHYLADGQPFLRAGRGQSLEKKLDMVQQLLQALAYLHRRSVLHRDLKPANVLVQDGTVRVLDFGLAIASDEQHTSSAGTLLYMAPELFEGVDYSKQADLYAVGVLITQLLTGQHPFEPADYAFLDRVLDEEPNLEKMVDWLQPFVRQLLAKTPKHRFDTAHHALERLLALSSENLSNTTFFGHADVLETADIRESYLQAATFVGRKQEMTQLTNALAKAGEGQGSAWLIGGESGVGKSRLLREVRTHALVNGFLTLTGQASETGAGSVYELWREPLRQLILAHPHVPDLDAGVLSSIVPDITALLGRPIPPVPVLDGEAAQIRLLTTIAKLFTEATQPVLLIMEDLHWATAGLAVLPYLTRQIDKATLLVIGSYRDDEHPTLAQTLSDMQPLPLNRLTTDNMADLSAAMLGERGQRPDILQRLQQETEGNAFFAVEVLRLLAEDMGGLSHIGDAPLPDLLLPDGIQGIVQRRLMRVPQQYHHLLQLAATAGRILDMHILEALSDHHHLERWLTTCAEAAVLDVVDDTWRFQHAKVRDGLLAMIPADIAKQHHQQVAQAIEQVYPDDPQYAAQLMVHWGQAGHPEKEGVYAYQAGTHAASNYANDDAIAYLTRAYELASTMNWADDDPATKRQYDILCKREEVYRLTGQPARQKADLDLLAALVDVLDKPEYHVEVALRQAGYTRTVTDFDAYRVFAERAVTQAHLAEDDLLVAKAYRLMGEALSTFHDYDGAINAFETACPLAEELEQYWELGRILTGLGMIANYKSEYDKAKAYYKQSLQMYKTIGDERSQAMTLTKLGVTTIRLAQYQETQGYLDESLEINVRIGYKLGEKMALHVLGMLCMSRGEPDQAQAFYQQGLAIAQQLGDKEGIAAAFNSLAGVMRVKGQIEEAYDYYLEGLKNYQAIGEKYGEAVALVNLGANRRNRPGVFEQAKQHLEESVRISGQLGNVDLEAYGFLCLGLLLSFFGDYKPAQSYFENVLVTYQQIGMRSREGETGHFLGGCLVAQHLFEPAKQHLQNAVMINREIGDAELIISTLNLLAWIAYLHGEYAQMLAYYQEALSEPTQDSIPAPHEQLVSQAGAAWSSLLVNGTYVESDIMPSLRYLDSDPLLLRQVGPFRLHLICYKLLQAVGDPRADEVLILAHEQIQTYASYIETPEWRASFLSNVPEQRELEDLYIARFSV